MELPKIKSPENYIGLYVFDFGDHAGVGFTAGEVAELLDSEKFKDCKAYKIYRAHPDGTMELKGVRPEIFQLESGMLFHSDEPNTAKNNFKKLINLAVRTAPPCRAKVHMAKYDTDKYAVALIYPAEYDDEVSKWLSDGDYKTIGEVQGGIGAVQRYYNEKPVILDQHQLFSKIESRTGQELLSHVKMAIQR